MGHTLTEQELDDLNLYFDGNVIEWIGNYDIETIKNHVIDTLKMTTSGGPLGTNSDYVRINQQFDMYNKGIKKPEVKKKLPNEVNVGISYTFSMPSFKKYFHNLTLITDVTKVKDYDLIIFPGGEDISPTYYGQKNRFSETNNKRDEIEFAIANEAIKRGIKMFGSCRGHQLLSILNGCEFVQDISSAGYDYHPCSHPVSFNKSGGLLFTHFNEKKVVSMHHQGATRLSSSKLFSEVCSYNGIIEGCEGRKVISTQFHPEFDSGNEAFFNALLDWATW